MPVLHNLATGRDEFVPNDALDRARASGNFVVPEGLTQTVTTGTGRTVEAPASAVPAATGTAGIKPATEIERGAAESAAYDEAEYGGVGSEILTGVEGAVDTVTGGLYGLGARKLAPDYNRRRGKRAEVNPVVNTVGKAAGLVGSVATGVGAGALATKAGGKVAISLGGGAAAKIAGLTAEGALVGGLEGVQQLTVSADPVTLDRAISTIGSNALLGGVTSGAVGIAGKALSKGISKGKDFVDDIASRSKAAANVPEDLAKLDSAGLRAAKETEEAAVDAARVTQKASVADELVALRQESKGAKSWLATEDKALRKVGLRADRNLDRLGDNLKGLAQNPRRALNAIQENAQVLEKIVEGGPALRKKIAEEAAQLGAEEAAKVGQSRLAALDGAEKLLQKYRAVEAKIDDLYTPLASPRLTQIQAAQDALASGGNKSLLGKLVDKAAQGGGMAVATGLLPGGPIGAIGAMVAPEVVKKLKDLTLSRLFRAGAESAGRSSAAVEAFLGVGRKAAKVAPVLASKVLTSTSFGEAPKREIRPAATGKKDSPLLSAFRARESELLQQVRPGPDGKPKMAPGARAAVSERLGGLKLVAPVVADQIESHVARRVEFLASKLPKRPDIAAMSVGPDRWQPSEADMRAFARYVAAVEDPGGVEERLVSGTVTPEDAEAYRAVYPERFEAFKADIIARLPELRASLPFARQIALSIFTEVPVHPSMHPAVLRTLQAMYTDEPGTEGGTEAPKPQPQMGSISKPEGTPAQERAR